MSSSETKNTRAYIAWLTPMSRTRPALPGSRVLVGRAAEELHQQRAGHVEALDHDRVHVGGQVVPLAHDALQPATEPAGREREHRQEHQGHQRELPRQDEHGGQHQS